MYSVILTERWRWFNSSLLLFHLKMQRATRNIQVYVLGLSLCLLWSCTKKAHCDAYGRTQEQKQQEAESPFTIKTWVRSDWHLFSRKKKKPDTPEPSPFAKKSFILPHWKWMDKWSKKKKEDSPFSSKAQEEKKKGPSAAERHERERSFFWRLIPFAHEKSPFEHKIKKQKKKKHEEGLFPKKIGGGKSSQ